MLNKAWATSKYEHVGITDVDMNSWKQLNEQCMLPAPGCTLFNTFSEAIREAKSPKMKMRTIRVVQSTGCLITLPNKHEVAEMVLKLISLGPLNRPVDIEESLPLAIPFLFIQLCNFGIVLQVLRP